MAKDIQYGMDVDAFLDHTASGGGSGTAYFRKWKKAGKATVWLHRHAGFVVKWAHGWPRFVELTDRDTGEKRVEVWSGSSWNCHEDELVLKRQNFRTPDDERETPPRSCPHCKLIEEVRRLVADGSLQLWDPIFRFEGSQEQFDVVLTAGGIYNAFKTQGNGSLSDREVAECRKHGIRFDDVWKENAKARCGYTFVVVDNARPENGVQIADEREALGQKMQRAIRDEIDRNGGGERGKMLGNPLRTPYPFLWGYDERASFSERYRVVALTAGEPALTDEIRELIESDPPDLARHLAPGNAAVLRADMERSALVKFDFDAIFKDVETTQDATEPDDDPDNPLTDAIRDVKADRVPEVGRGKTEPAPAPEDVFECDHCGGALKGTDFVCPHCGAKYDDNGVIVSRPCLKCKTQIDTVQGDRFICEKCATIHEVKDDEWVTVEPEKAAPVRRTRSQARAASTDDIPFGTNGVRTDTRNGGKR